MSPALRRVATFLLLLAVPLRVYAAVAMMFCGQPGQSADDARIASGIEHVQSSATMHAQMHGHSDDAASMEHGDDRHDHDGAAGGANEHLSCGACCCTGMIATAYYDWQPQSFATPATPAFVAIAVPSVVAHRLERPPRPFLA